MTRFLLFVLLCFCCLLACKKAEEPVNIPADPNGNNGTDTTSTDTSTVDTTSTDTLLVTNPQVVLLENLTGFRNTNSPAAADLAENLAEIYGDQLIVVSVHSTNQFSTPNPPGSDSFTTDFRTEAGSEYQAAFGNPGLPKGLVNRREFDGSATQAFSAWPERVEEIIQETAEAEIRIEGLTYNSTSREVSFNVSMVTAEGLNPGSYFMTLYLTEDSIVDWQAFPGGIEQSDYLHRHVLRDNINGTWGDEVFNSADPAQENTLSYQYTLDDECVEERCAIIAYIYHGDTKEIVQADKHLVMNE